MKRFLVVLLAAMALAPGGASADALVAQDGVPQPFQGWADSSRLALPPYPIKLRFGEYCGGDYGCAQLGESITLENRRCGLARHLWRSCRFVFMHEMGHMVDGALLSPEKERQFEEAAGLSGDWWGGGFGMLGDSPAEAFADAWAMCALGRWRTQLRVGVRERQPLHLQVARNELAPLCALIANFD